jgi:hypothetical protein
LYINLTLIFFQLNIKRKCKNFIVVKNIKIYKAVAILKIMGKIMLGLAGIVLAATAGCVDYSYGARGVYYIMGPHGEPAPVTKSDDAFQCRSAEFVKYKTAEDKEVMILNYYPKHRVGDCKPYTYLPEVDENGKLKFLPVEIVISKKDSEVYSAPSAASPAKKTEFPVLPTKETPIPTPPQRSGGIALPPSSSK